MGPLGHFRLRPGATRSSLRARGQMLVLFVLSIFVLTGITALVVDVSWYWANTLKVQRAADAAALAGVVWLPGAPGSAYSTARATATENGYTDGTGGVTVYPIKDPANNRRLWVTVTAPVRTYFMRIFGINSITASRMSKAEYVLPVPMGSPENYYGNFGLTRGLTSTTTTTTFVDTPYDTNWDAATAVPATTWTTPLRADGTSNTAYAISPVTANSTQQWSTFGSANGFTGGASPQLPAGTIIDGLQVQMRALLSGSTNPTTTCQLGVDLSWDGGTSWSTAQTTAALTTTKKAYGPWGTSVDTAAWGGHTWLQSDFTNANFRTRLTWLKPSCGVSRTVSVDTLQVRVYGHTHVSTPVTTTTPLADKNLQGPGSACTTGVASCYEADGTALNPRGFWATMNTEGAANVNGDAFQPYYDTPTSGVAPACSSATGDRACYDASNYYNYAVEMPPGSIGGSVYVYDPVFCDVTVAKGTGDRWFSGTNGMTSMYELYNTNNTLYDIADDGSPFATSGGLFRQISASDTSMGGSGGSECKYTTDTPYGDGRDYHDRWYRLYSGLTGGPTGTVYRLHTSSTDPTNVAQQRNTDGESSFALYASATGGTPRIYGLGAMQMFTPLSSSGGSTFSEFYMAQIEAVHAGKTMEIKLWDPGDTNPLSANLQIEIPTASGWSATPFSWTSAVGTPGTSGSPPSSCNGDSGNNVSSVVTSNPSSQFNGCWVTIDVVIPIGYTAPQSGWWKIKYNMTGSGTSNDVTTWKVQIKGNPVHLVVP